MRSTEQQRSNVRDGLTLLLVATLIVSYLQHSHYDMATPTLDALRYVDYALNIHDHQVFGLSGTARQSPPAPGNANSPLYPALIAAAFTVDAELADSLRCAVIERSNAQICPRDYTTIVVIQCALVVGALMFLWFTAMRLFQRRTIAWGACGLALASTKPMFYANHLLTEILVLFLFAALMAALVALCDNGRARSWAVVGGVLGALTLTRPEYLYLGYALALAGIVSTVFGRRRQQRAARLAAGVLAFAFVTGPWLARNEHHFGVASVTGGYGDVILAYRAAYNRMSPAEWAAAFIYWLPGHGEALAARFLPPALTAKLGTDADSYLYRDGEEIFDAGLAAVGGEREQLASYLLRTEILEHPWRHFAASLPLVWRGILAGKYLAVAGVPCLALLCIIAVRRKQAALLLIMLPPAVMISLYAAVSVSVPRYNVYLIYYYGIAVSWAFMALVDRHVTTSPP
ncbi:MAG: glycosyltransferase family 39 protein [Gammaproteobacteria bacterium]|jgi:hypothetical protein